MNDCSQCGGVSQSLDVNEARVRGRAGIPYTEQSRRWHTGSRVTVVAHRVGMMRRTIQCYLTVLVMPMVVQCTSVLGPRTLRPHSTYRAVLAGGSSALTLDVAVEGRRATGEPYSQSREVQLRPGTSRILDLEIGDPGPGDYALRVRSTSGAFFESSAPLVYQPRTFCVFVETDKRVYQPGDTIYFRIVSLDKVEMYVDRYNHRSRRYQLPNFEDLRLILNRMLQRNL
ncbi:hypothetical protein EVAR_33414_1 [Eumeta japonica]|uniref:Uncharacterized protein n=1 Tax=Eumeta variegata TaxID=151549 RepID=A0A4C1W0D2_EUMVA|nr:hypothetical protein EVAR_33414_1 [Eumeta japonica]